MPTSSAPPAAVARHRGLVARTVLVSGLTLVSRLLGFVREALMAAVFGDRSVISDAFLTAWRFPNLFRRLLGEGALSVSLQSAMTKADIERGDAAGRALFRATLRLMAWILVGVTVAAIALTAVLPDHAPFFGGEWLGPVPGAVRELTIRVMPYVLLVCLAAVCGGALAVRGHYAMPNLAPTAMNVIWIATLVAIGVASGWGMSLGATPEAALARQLELARWLAWGLLLGGVVQLLLHLVPLRRHGLVGAVGEERGDAWKVLRTTGPLVVGAAIYQVNVMVDGLMANGLLRPGGSTVLYLANRVQQFPLALISTAAINAVFPLLNAHGHLGERGKVRSLHDRTQLGVLFLALPAAAGMVALALPIASVCYEHGNFGADGTERVAVGLVFLALALVPAGASGLTSRVYVAMDDLRSPVRIALWMVPLNVGLNALCVVGLGLDIAGLTLATVVTTWANLFLLVRGLRSKLALPAGDPAFAGRVVRIVLASLACGLAAWAGHRGLVLALDVDVPRRSVAALIGGMLAGGATYVLAARALGIGEYREIVRRIRERLTRR
jgi:putative peptidoglycan lipid II flippase